MAYFTMVGGFFSGPAIEGHANRGVDPDLEGIVFRRRTAAVHAQSASSAGPAGSM